MWPTLSILMEVANCVPQSGSEVLFINSIIWKSYYSGIIHTKRFCWFPSALQKLAWDWWVHVPGPSCYLSHMTLVWESSRHSRGNSGSAEMKWLSCQIWEMVDWRLYTLCLFFILSSCSLFIRTSDTLHITLVTGDDTINKNILQYLVQYCPTWFPPHGAHTTPSLLFHRKKTKFWNDESAGFT